MKRADESALRSLGDAHALGADRTAALARLLGALAAEPDPPTAIRTPGEALEGHVADSLSGLEVTELAGATRIADVGAGTGFPGLALAAALPSASVDLIEAGRRKAEVIDRLIDAAGLVRARSIARRAEDWGSEEGAGAYDAVTARAVAPLAVLVEYAAPLLAPDGVLVAWKGRRSAVEEAAGNAAAKLLGMGPATVLEVTPFEGAHSRHLHVYRKVGPTPPGFPRRAGMAAKRPLA